MSERLLKSARWIDPYNLLTVQILFQYLAEIKNRDTPKPSSLH